MDGWYSSIQEAWAQGAHVGANVVDLRTKGHIFGQ